MLYPIEKVGVFAQGLDHPEGLAVARDGTVYAGGEAGQVYRISPDGKKVEVLANTGGFCLGLTLGVGSLILMFLNGVMLGAICLDYLVDGQGPFLAGWLLPHGSVEIPAMLIAAQAGLVLGAAMVGREAGPSIAARVRAVGRDLLLLLWGMTVLLVWAGIIESYFSQIHEPRLPYAAKAAYGAVQLCLLAAFLFLPRKREGT